jgi:hypothetical protein
MDDRFGVMLQLAEQGGAPLFLLAHAASTERQRYSRDLRPGVGVARSIAVVVAAHVHAVAASVRCVVRMPDHARPATPAHDPSLPTRSPSTLPTQTQGVFGCLRMA